MFHSSNAHNCLKVLNSVPNKDTVVNVTRVHHSKFLQNTIVARIEAKGNTSENKELVILGAHQVSIYHQYNVQPKKKLVGLAKLQTALL